MRALKWAIVAALLIISFLAIRAVVYRNVHVSLIYCVEARFDTMPPNDKALADWLRSQPGVVPHTVAIGRFEQGGKLLYVRFLQSRNMAGEPPFPDLDGRVSALAYAESDGPFRDASDRSRAITME
jgi:hypothetical protein